ncbi:hypothetical protein DL96DRAFT_348903 [Flagelloscypha sp. PMI_526]|nr:hypothetical protein DL96DRAFT_348903 [Flagelloscypha sp. PMI_526]
MLELPPESWERIFCYVPKSEVLCLRLVCRNFLRAIPESYMHVRQLDLSVVQRDPRTEALPTFINKVLKTVLSRKQNDGQTQSLVLTPQIEFIESMAAPPSLMRQLWKFLPAFMWLDSTAYKVRTKIIGQIVSSLPHIRTVAIVESPVLENITGDPWKSIIPLRCSYVDILWAQFSEQLTDLEIWVATETVWPTYCPGGATELPNLRILRIRWDRDIHSCVALRLASKAPNLEELAVFQPPSSVSNVLPHDPQLLGHLRVFRWVDNTTVYSVDPNIARFFQTFSSQLKDISLITSRLPEIENILPLEKLDILRIDLSAGSLFTHREILLRRIETTNHKLRALVLQCVTWGTGDVQRLFQALGRLPTIRDLCLFLPTYSNTWT